MSMYDEAEQSLNDAERDVRFRDMTVDQKLEYAKVQSLLSISQELSLIRHQGINPQYIRS